MTIREILKKYHQEHLLSYLETLNETEKSAFLAELERVNFSVLEELALAKVEDGCEIQPIPYLKTEEVEHFGARYAAAGKEAIKRGKLACVLLAGGQGTRLGFDHPKGMYNIGISHPIYIFQLHIERLLEIYRETGAFVPLFIMTSDLNRLETENFFISHDYFGYPKEKVRFFVQGMAPCVDFCGKVLLQDRLRPAVSPDGNGGWYAALKSSDILKEFQDVAWFNVFGVDNVLAKPADPVFLGATILRGEPCGVKGVKKTYPEERVGLLVLKEGIPAVVEYYEMDSARAALRNDRGELTYNFGVTLNYLFQRDKLEEIAAEKLPVHFAKKKVGYFDGEGKIVPERENAYKFETLILDMVKGMGSCLAFETVREREFAPVKNLTGVDSVDSARELLKLNGMEL